MAKQKTLPPEAERRLIWPIRLTWLGLFAERLVRCFWPFFGILLTLLAVLMLGLHDTSAVEVVWTGAVLGVLGLVATLARGVWAFDWPRRGDAIARLDRSLPGRPLTALADTQAIGAGDGASEAVWSAHVRRMAERAATAKAVEPDLRVSDRDPYALRFVALSVFLIALVFGSVWRVSSVADMAPGAAGNATLASGPAWEGWVEPPIHTGKPSLYLNDITDETLEVPEGSQVTIRLYGEVGDLTISETVSGRTEDLPAATDIAQSFEVTQGGRIEIAGPDGRAWTIRVNVDTPPTVEFDGPMERAASGEMRQPFYATDDYAVVSGTARIRLNMDELDRRHGLATEPEPRDAITLDLPMTITGDRKAFAETLIENLSEHPWAGMPVTISLQVEDAIGQIGLSVPSETTLPGRRFFDPLAASIVEQRRDLLWTRENASRVTQILRAVSYRPDDIFRDYGAYLMLREAIRQLEGATRAGDLTGDLRDEIAQVLWDVALMIEQGDLSDALARLERIQEQLAEAIENGATDEEIAELMQELREAMQEYMRQLAQEQSQQGDQQQAQTDQEMQEITGDQLEQMLQQLQELMEQGRMAEAQQLLDQLRQMMENMQIAQGQQGQGQPSPGQQAMEGLAETLRDQQGLSDDSFQDLQEQFGQGQQGQQGQQPGQQGQQPGQGDQFGQNPGQGQGQGAQPGEEPGGPGSLADRQQALRDQLQRQQQGLPGAGTAEGEAAREALDRAGRAMENAEEALRDNDLAGALDDQAEAMEALRDGIRELGEAMAQEQQGQTGGDGTGQANAQGNRDPLGREAGQTGRIGTDEDLLQGEDVYRRARELLDEIRRRSGEQLRPEEEREYLRRLLDRF